MKRRDFLRTAGGAAGATAAASAASSSAAAERGVGAIQDEGGNTTQSDGGTGDGGNQSEGGGNQSEGGGAAAGGGTQEITVGPEGDQFTFSPSDVTIAPGTTVTFTWGTDGHNVVPQSQPDGANWEGNPEIVGSGSTHEHTFETVGTYEYLCEPHAPGMSGSIEVAEGGGGGGGGGYEPPEPHNLGIPVQKHFVGAMAFMGVFVTLVFTFYLLKYGESAHTAAPGKRD